MPAFVRTSGMIYMVLNSYMFYGQNGGVLKKILRRIGILLAVFAIIPLASARGGYLGDFINLSALDNGLGAFLVSPAAKIVSLIVFGLLMLTMCKFTIWHKENRK